MIYQGNELERYLGPKTKRMKRHLQSVIVSFLCLVAAFYLSYYEELQKREEPTVAEVEEANTPNLVAEEPVNIQAGDTLNSVLEGMNIDKEQINQAIQAIKKVFNPRDLKASQDVFITTSPQENGTNRNLLTLIIRPNINSEIVLEQKEDGTYEANKNRRELERHIKVYEGHIRSSLYIDAIKNGVPSKAVHLMIKALSYDVDFQRSIKPGDRFKVVYELLVDPKNKTADVGRLLCAQMDVENKSIDIYYFDKHAQYTGYFHKNGRSVQKTLLRTPIDGARISSGFGRRIHPVLGFSKMHKGVDFAAPIGTPIYASGNGVVEYAGRKSSYGNYVLIRHTMSNMKTAYAHLSRFAAGMRSGKVVRQGEVIGYVGVTGRTTGAHLHYEVLVNNVQINPQSVKMESNFKLAGKFLNEFAALAKRVDRLTKKAKQLPDDEVLRVDENLKPLLHESPSAMPPVSENQT